MSRRCDHEAEGFEDATLGRGCEPRDARNIALEGEKDKGKLSPLRSSRRDKLCPYFDFSSVKQFSVF